MTKYVNLTPHTVVLNDGREFPVSGMVARVQETYSEFVDDIAETQFGDIEGLPEPKDGVVYIVSGIVRKAANRRDVVSPATGHPDCVRSEDKKTIISVPGFIRG